MRKERLDAITDAVLAIIVTLLVLEIKIPELTMENTPKILQQIFVYAGSFVTIAILWLSHHNIFVHAERICHSVVWINFFLLFATSLIPLATAPLSEHFHERPSHILYGLVVGLVSFLYSLLQDQNARKSKIKLKASIHWVNWVTCTLYFTSIPLSYFSIYFSTAIFVFCPVMYFILSRKPIE
jgi:uncharacterized membrane protein